MSKVQKGLYIEQKNNRSVFLMADGQFVHGRPVKLLAIGEEGDFYPLAVQKKRNWLPIVAPAIPIFAMLILFFSTLLPAGNAFAYVQLEMESSIEFGVDSAYQVISIRELDEGGKKLITQLGTWKGEELGELIERSIAISIGERNEEVTITTATDENGETSEILLDQLVLNASAAAVKQDINVHLKKATFSQRDQSIEENVPVGQKVEHFVSLVKEDKSKMERDSKKKSENYLKALKDRNDPALLMDQVIDTQTTSKSDVSGQKALDKEEPKERNEEPKASSKVEVQEKSNKTEKAKPAAKDSKPITSELKQETTAEPVEKLKPMVKDEPVKILDKTPLKEVDNQESQPEVSKEKQIPKSIIVDNVQERLLEETVYPKSRKPVIEKVIDDQLMKQDTLEKSLVDVINGEKQE